MESATASNCLPDRLPDRLPDPRYGATAGRAGAGVAVSILLHLMLLMALRDRVFPNAERVQPAQRMTLEVFLPPLKRPAPAPEAPATPRLAIPRTSEPPPPKHHAVPHAEPSVQQSRTTNPSTELSTESPTASSTPPPAPERAQREAPSHYIDPDAALANVPGILKQLDNEKRKLPVGQLMDKPLYGPDEESRLGHRMAQAGRSDCLKDGGAGLLTPLIWLAQKKGTGCKW